jgi:hypothetical protein
MLYIAKVHLAYIQDIEVVGSDPLFMNFRSFIAMIQEHDKIHKE